MQSDDKERVAGKAEREVRTFRIAADGRIPLEQRRVVAVELTQLRPQQSLEAVFVRVGRTTEHGRECDEVVAGECLCLSSKRKQVASQSCSRLFRADALIYSQ